MMGGGGDNPRPSCGNGLPDYSRVGIIMEPLKQSAGARRCQSQRRARGNHRYMQGHNKDYSGFKCVIMFSSLYSFILKGSLHPEGGG